MQNNTLYNKEFGAVYCEAKARGDIKRIGKKRNFYLDFKYRGARMSTSLGNSEMEVENNFGKLFENPVIEHASGVDTEGEEVEYEEIALKDITNISYEVG